MRRIFIESVVENSVYYQELEVLSALINARCLRLKAVALYKGLWRLGSAMASGRPRAVPTAGLESLLDEILKGEIGGRLKGKGLVRTSEGGEEQHAHGDAHEDENGPDGAELKQPLPGEPAKQHRTPCGRARFG